MNPNLKKAAPISSFPHTVTLYDPEVERCPDATERITNRITILRGVFMEMKDAVNAKVGGSQEADGAAVIVPMDVAAEDGLTGREQKYCSPSKYDRRSEKVLSEFYTFKPGTSFFVWGEVVEPEMSFNDIRREYGGTYMMKSAAPRFFGELRHWQIEGV